MERVKDVVTRNLKEQCGVEWVDVFATMDDKALGSASIGQVHRAVLTDEALSQAKAVSNYRGGPEVAVKVMHPGVEEMVRCDFQVFRWLCRLALPEWKGFLDELERGMMTEFDYRDEAEGLSHVRENMANSPYWDHVRVPEPVQYLTSKEVLVMEMLTGPKLMSAIQEELVAAFGDKQKAEEFISARKREILHGKQSGADSLTHLLHDFSFAGKLRLRALVRKCRRYIKTLVDVHGHQIFLDACFNGDPHFGNILLLDNDRLGLIDFGVTRRLADKERIGLAKVVSALGSGRDDATVSQAMWDLGFALGDRDDDAMMVKYAKLFFESDQESEDQGFATPQHYFSSLMEQNPLVHIPNPAVFVARISFLFRGMGSAVGWGQVNCCSRWCKQAQQALMIAGVEGGHIGDKGDSCYSMSLRPVR
jgi:predicted unusual protein kinase regulating ubiquinone biosynthesis (AarF/ABC1/UbiB family)